MHRFANPNRFARLSRAYLSRGSPDSPLFCSARVCTSSLFASPPDYQQGESVRIMYVHVPAAWMALFCYTNMAIAAAVGLIWKHPVADLAAKATAPIGACFTFLALLTGSLWGKPMWGTWWVWDARLTSMLVLFFLYLGYMALHNAFDDPARGVRASSILALVGFVNVPIIKFSVDWWYTLHQPASIVRMGRTERSRQHAVAARTDGGRLHHLLPVGPARCGCAARSSPTRSACCACAKCMDRGGPLMDSMQIFFSYGWVRRVRLAGVRRYLYRDGGIA